MGKTAEIMGQLELTETGDFTPSQVERFKSDPEFYKKFVKLIEQDVNGNFPIVRILLLCISVEGRIMLMRTCRSSRIRSWPKRRPRSSRGTCE